MNTIWNSLPTDTCKIANHRGLTFVADTKIGFRLTWDHWGARLMLIDLTNALQRGKVCEELTITAEMGDFTEDGGTNHGLNFVLGLLRDRGFNMRTLHADLLALTWVKHTQWNSWTENAFHGAKVHRHSKKAVRVFSPFAKVPALKAVPARWTLDLTVRALLNGQFTDCKCDQHLTDDYAFDAATNFGVGSAEGMSLAKKLIEDPSGWRSRADGGTKVAVSCFHFSYYSFDYAFIGEDAPTA